MSFNGFYIVAVAVQRQRVIYTDYSGFASPALGRHISTFVKKNDVVPCPKKGYVTHALSEAH
jgi:hypothetical protein